MEMLFETLSRAVEGSALLALAASLAWGVLSIILSPCHLASIPLIVGFIDRQGRTTLRRAFVIAMLFAAGILITIALVGAVTAAAGRMMGDVGRYGNYGVAAIFFLVGLHLLDVLPAPWAAPGTVSMRRRGPLAAFILGLVFGIALGPCTFAYMAPMLAVAFKFAASDPVYGVLLLSAYGIGHCSVIVLAGTFTGAVQQYLNWSESTRSAALLRAVCGIAVIAGGLWMLYSAH